MLPASSSEEDVVLPVAGAWRALSCLPTTAARCLSGVSEQGAPALSAREVRWLRALADGATVAGLARTSGYSQREMHRLLAAVYGRLGTDNRTEALLRADRAGLLSVDAVPTQPGPGQVRSTTGGR